MKILLYMQNNIYMLLKYTFNVKFINYNFINRNKSWKLEFDSNFNQLKVYQA